MNLDPLILRTQPPVPRTIIDRFYTQFLPLLSRADPMSPSLIKPHSLIVVLIKMNSERHKTPSVTRTGSKNKLLRFSGLKVDNGPIKLALIIICSGFVVTRGGLSGLIGHGRFRESEIQVSDWIVFRAARTSGKKKQKNAGCSTAKNENIHFSLICWN